LGKKKDGKVIVKVSIPVNTIATIILPATTQEKVTESGKPLSQNVYLKDIKAADKNLSMQAGSGDYVFEIIE